MKGGTHTRASTLEMSTLRSNTQTLQPTTTQACPQDTSDPTSFHDGFSSLVSCLARFHFFSDLSSLSSRVWNERPTAFLPLLRVLCVHPLPVSNLLVSLTAVH